jgi:hypothetical protein
MAMRELFDGPGIETAFITGVMLAALGWFLHQRVQIAWSFVAVVAAVAGLSIARIGSVTLVLALLILGVGGWVSGQTGRWWLVAVCAVPGAVVLAQSVTSVATTWMRTATVVAVVVASPLVLSCQRRAPRVTPLLAMITVFGIFVCVPETDPIRCLMVAVLPAGAYGVLVLAKPSAAATSAFVGIATWTAVTGGAVRPGAVVGGLASFGLLLLPPLVARRSWVVVLAVDAVLVAFISRVAGDEVSARAAMTLVLPAFALAAVVLVVAYRVQRRVAAAR